MKLHWTCDKVIFLPGKAGVGVAEKVPAESVVRPPFTRKLGQGAGNAEGSLQTGTDWFRWAWICRID